SVAAQLDATLPGRPPILGTVSVELLQRPLEIRRGHVQGQAVDRALLRVLDAARVEHEAEVGDRAIAQAARHGDPRLRLTLELGQHPIVLRKRTGRKRRRVTQSTSKRPATANLYDARSIAFLSLRSLPRGAHAAARAPRRVPELPRGAARVPHVHALRAASAERLQ